MVVYPHHKKILLLGQNTIVVITIINRIQNLIAIKSLQATAMGFLSYAWTGSSCSQSVNQNGIAEQRHQLLPGLAETVHWGAFFSHSRRASESSIDFDYSMTTTSPWFLVSSSASSDLYMWNHRLAGAIASLPEQFTWLSPETQASSQLFQAEGVAVAIFPLAWVLNVECCYWAAAPCGHGARFVWMCFPCITLGKSLLSLGFWDKPLDTGPEGRWLIKLT